MWCGVEVMWVGVVWECQKCKWCKCGVGVVDDNEDTKEKTEQRIRRAHKHFAGEGEACSHILGI